jgi:hypothetical protein
MIGARKYPESSTSHLGFDDAASSSARAAFDSGASGGASGTVTVDASDGGLGSCATALAIQLQLASNDVPTIQRIIRLPR